MVLSESTALCGGIHGLEMMGTSACSRDRTSAILSRSVNMTFLDILSVLKVGTQSRTLRKTP